MTPDINNTSLPDTGVDAALREARTLLSDLSLGKSIHNDRFPGSKIEGGLWDRIPSVVRQLEAALSARASVAVAVGVTSLIEEYRNLVKTGAEYAASELRLAPTSAFEIYMGHFRDIGKDIEAALASLTAPVEETAEPDKMRRVTVPQWFIDHFMTHRHFFAAKDIDIVARKDGKEYHLEGDWLKDFVPGLVAPESASGRECKYCNNPATCKSCSGAITDASTASPSIAGEEARAKVKTRVLSELSDRRLLNDVDPALFDDHRGSE